jgi:hypothetical protein
MIRTAAGRAGGGGVCRRTIHGRDSSTWSPRSVCDKSRDGDFRIRLWSNPTRKKRNTIMELIMATPPRLPTC